jgi:uncharacterized protein with HEPN domain
MSEKDPRVYILDILKEIENLAQFSRPFPDEDSFVKNRQAVYACARSLEILGEAAKKVPKSIRNRYPSVEWKEMVGMRDKLIHDYANTRSAVIWNTVKKDLPPLKAALEAMLKELG